MSVILPRRDSGRLAILPALLLGAIGLAVLGLVRQRATQSSSSPSTALRPRPVRVAPCASRSGAIGQPFDRRALSRLMNHRPHTLSGLLHLRRLMAADSSLHVAWAGRDVDPIEFVLDHERSLTMLGGVAPLIDTRDGVRCRIADRENGRRQVARESHEDQLLAVLAELGLPLDHPLSTAGGVRTVGRLLDDALAKFDLDQEEIEWSALAFALYLPPRNSWVDRFGRRFTFDDLAGKLMALAPQQRACAGTHLLYTLAVLGQVDRQIPILSDAVNRRLWSYLRKKVETLASRQSDDGSWGEDWHGHGDGKGSLPDRVLVTGHSVEWVVMLPAESQVPREGLLRALEWLGRQLQTCPDDLILTHYCPYSHAGRVLLLLSGPEQGEAGPPEFAGNLACDHGR